MGFGDWLQGGSGTDDPDNCGLPDAGLPIADLAIDPELVRFTQEIAALQHRVPRLRPDSESSCPRPPEDVCEYLACEEGFPPGKPPGFKFFRTGALLDTKWWVWRYTDCYKKPAYVSVHLRGRTACAATSGAPATLSSDQVLLWMFGRMLHDDQCRLVREGDRWRIANLNEAAAARAAKLGVRTDAIPADGLPDFHVLRSRISIDSPTFVAQLYAPLRSITVPVPRLPDDSPTGCPVPQKEIRTTAWIYGLVSTDEMLTNPQRAKGIMDDPAEPPGWRFLRTGHVMDMLAWVWTYRSDRNPTALVVADQRATDTHVSDFHSVYFLTVDQLLYAVFLHRIENDGLRLVRRAGVWTLEAA